MKIIQALDMLAVLFPGRDVNAGYNINKNAKGRIYQDCKLQCVSEEVCIFGETWEACFLKLEYKHSLNSIITEPELENVVEADLVKVA